jgi:hypothetical protein
MAVTAVAVAERRLLVRMEQWLLVELLSVEVGKASGEAEPLVALRLSIMARHDYSSAILNVRAR